ncbi:unnamed protein product, partial [Allacma fusca]
MLFVKLSSHSSVVHAFNAEGNVSENIPTLWASCKNELDVGGAIIDGDYRGIAYVSLFNHSSEAFNIHRGDRIAQLIICPYEKVMVREVEVLDDTAR